MNEKNYWLILGAILAAIGVSAGAAGAHLLQPIISEVRFVTFNKAVRYQMYHSFALIFVSILSTKVIFSLFAPLDTRNLTNCGSISWWGTGLVGSFIAIPMVLLVKSTDLRCPRGFLSEFAINSLEF